MVDARRVNKTIFLVDENAAVSCALSGFLENSGYRVRSFPSAESFLGEADDMAEVTLLLEQRMTSMSSMELQAEFPLTDSQGLIVLQDRRRSPDRRESINCNNDMKANSRKYP